MGEVDDRQPFSVISFEKDNSLSIEVPVADHRFPLAERLGVLTTRLFVAELLAHDGQGVDLPDLGAPFRRYTIGGSPSTGQGEVAVVVDDQDGAAA